MVAEEIARGRAMTDRKRSEQHTIVRKGNVKHSLQPQKPQLSPVWSLIFMQQRAIEHQHVELHPFLENEVAHKSTYVTGSHLTPVQ